MYEVLASGSKGNCTVINNMMFDCGIPYNKKLEKYLYHIDYLFITHEHKDHINKSTLRKISEYFPRIKIIANLSTSLFINIQCGIKKKVFIASPNENNIDGFKFTAFECEHNVECYGYVFETEGKNVIYATDTGHLLNAPNIKYDYLFLESNHSEERIEEARNNNTYGYDVYGNAKRHLSTEQCKEFFERHKRDSTSVLVELHKSERFY